MLGVPPALGRHFSAEDDRPGAEPVVILSHEVWQRRYQGDPEHHRPQRLGERPAAHGRRA